MAYSLWQREPERPFHERRYRREGLPAWDMRWQSLSVAARAHFLRDAKPRCAAAPATARRSR
jgi:hypothetical protein